MVGTGTPPVSSQSQTLACRDHRGVCLCVFWHGLVTRPCCVFASLAHLLVQREACVCDKTKKTHKINSEVGSAKRTSECVTFYCVEETAQELTPIIQEI